MSVAPHVPATVDATRRLIAACSCAPESPDDSETKSWVTVPAARSQQSLQLTEPVRELAECAVYVLVELPRGPIRLVGTTQPDGGLAAHLGPLDAVPELETVERAGRDDGDDRRTVNSPIPDTAHERTAPGGTDVSVPRLTGT
jgi:hypothetical protein